MADKDETGPERTCIVTRRKGAPEDMIRFVLGPEGRVVPDVRRRLPGRGVWVQANEALVRKAAGSGLFARGFKTKVPPDPGLADEVGALLETDALQSLAMANKAGAVTTGFAKVEALLAEGRAAVLLHAADAAEDGVRKLEAVARRSAVPPASIKLFASVQLDLALGRTNVIHAALAVGPVSEAFLTRCRRCQSYRTAPAHPKVGAEEASA